MQAIKLGFDNLFFPGAVAIIGMVVALGLLSGEVLAGMWKRREDNVL